jgi:serine phosphatase RsbU (regulator of sigma subunit)
MRIVVEQGEAVFFDQHVTGGTIYVGRHEHCQIKLSGDEQIAHRHLMIFEEKGRWFIEPLHDQYHSTHLDGHLLQEKQEVSKDSEVTLGGYKIKLSPKEKAKDKGLPFQVIARGHSELQETAGLLPSEMDLPEDVIIKRRNDTFSLSKGRMEYISGLALRFMDIADVRGLLSVLLDAILDDFDATCVWMGLRTDAEGHLNLSAGKDLFGRSIDAPVQAERFKFATVECARALIQQSLGNDPERSCMAGPLVGPDGSLGMIYLESAKGKPRYNVADLDTLVFICNQVAMTIDRLLRMQTNQIDKIRSLDQELARKVQARTAPWQLPQWPGLKVGALIEPGTGACTDFHDIVPLGAEYGMILIGQVSAGQPDTAIGIAEFSAAFRIGAVHRDVPQVLMRQINWVMFNSSGEPRRITGGVLGIDPVSGEFNLCLAGNVFAYLVRAEGKVVRIRTEGNPLVAESRKSKYEAAKGRLNPGQILVLCTGGLFSLASASDERFTEEHLLDFLSDNADQIPARILSDLVDDISGYTGGKKPANDITLLLLQKSNSAD